MFNVNILRTPDIPDIDAVVIVDTKYSFIQLVQIIGRIVKKKQHDTPSGILIAIENLSIEEIQQFG